MIYLSLRDWDEVGFSVMNRMVKSVHDIVECLKYLEHYTYEGCIIYIVYDIYRYIIGVHATYSEDMRGGII